MILSSLFEQLFGSKQDVFARLDGSQREILEMAIDHVLENIDPRICVVPGYRKRLAPAVAHAVEHVRCFLQALPEPMQLGRGEWASDPRVNAFFAVADDIPRLFGRSSDLRDFFEDPAHRGLGEAYALLVMEKHENSVLGTALENGVLRRDVPQTTLGFSGHRIAAPAASLREARIAVGKRGLQRILDVALKKIAALQEQASDFEERKAFLSTRLRLLKSSALGVDAHDAERNQEIMLIEARLAEATTALSTHEFAAHAMEPYLDIVMDVLANAEQFLHLSEVAVRVNRLGVVVPDESLEVAHDLMFNMCQGAEMSVVIALVKCRREDMPSRESLLAAAEKYLL